MARAAVKNSDDSLDIVQDAMFTLARKYAHKPETQWRPLFHRILQNRITDWHRRNLVRKRLFVSPSGITDEDAFDPLDSATGPATNEPTERGLAPTGAMDGRRGCLRGGRHAGCRHQPHRQRAYPGNTAHHGV